MSCEEDMWPYQTTTNLGVKQILCWHNFQYNRVTDISSVRKEMCFTLVRKATEMRELAASYTVRKKRTLNNKN